MKKAYVCSSLRPEVYERVTYLLSLFPEMTFLRPHATQLEDKAKWINQDVEWINEADELWVVGEYGRDCSWEIGFAMGINKPVVVIVDPSNAQLILNDWMMWYGRPRVILISQEEP